MKPTDYTNHPVANAVLPLKSDAVKRANDKAAEIISKVRADLKSHGMDREAAAPYPFRVSAWSPDYEPARRKANLYGMLSRSVASRPMGRGPDIVVMDDEACERFADIARKDAAAQYDAFVAKLVGKISNATTAKLEGNHVWGESFLTVTKEDGTREIWKTHMIVNVSKLGNLFNQWPTRKVKRR